MLESWWIWIAAALGFAIAETLAPVFVFLGFAAGAATVGVLLALGVGFGGVLWMFVTFSVVSLVATLALRRVLGTTRDETKTYTDDINEG